MWRATSDSGRLQSLRDVLAEHSAGVRSREALVRQLKDACAVNALSVEVIRRDGSMSVVRPPFVISEHHIQFCSNDPFRANPVSIPFDQIRSIQQRWSAAATEAEDSSR